jgi:hypothetical protein
MMVVVGAPTGADAWARRATALGTTAASTAVALAPRRARSSAKAMNAAA